jgi:hypothetical protein
MAVLIAVQVTRQSGDWRSQERLPALLRCDGMKAKGES